MSSFAAKVNSNPQHPVSESQQLTSNLLSAMSDQINIILMT